MAHLIRKSMLLLKLKDIYKFSCKYFSTDSWSIKEARGIVTPYINLDHITDSYEVYESNLLKRGCHENLNELYSLWNSYKLLLKEKDVLEEKREANRLSIKHKSDVHIEELKTVGKKLRDEFKEITGKITQLENVLIPRVLSLPNSLNAKVSNSQVVIESFLDPIRNEFNHLLVGKQLDVLEYGNPYSYFFKGVTALYELAVCRSVVKKFCDSKFIRLSNPDFSKMSLVKGWIDRDINKHLLVLNKSFQTGQDLLFLNGGSHFLMFCAPFVNSIIDFSNLPLKFVCQGRYYSPAAEERAGLFNVVQNMSVNFFIAADEKSCAFEFDNVINIIWKFYKSLGIPAQIVYSPLSELTFSESMRASIRVFSPFNNKYYEVANICKTDDFVSKRLRMYYKSEKDLKFHHIIHGNALKVPVLIACLLENNPEKSLLMFHRHLKLFDVK